MIVTGAAAIAGAVATVSATNGVADSTDMHWIVVAEGICPDDMHWSIDLGLCIATTPGDMHW